MEIFFKYFFMRTYYAPVGKQATMVHDSIEIGFNVFNNQVVFSLVWLCHLLEPQRGVKIKIEVKTRRVKMSQSRRRSTELYVVNKWEVWYLLFSSNFIN